MSPKPTACSPYCSSPSRGELPAPRVFIAPQRYIQGQGVLRGLGRYLSLMKAKRVVLLMSERGSRNDGVPLLASLR